jgi:NTP pyrophosphatase (non-canonical NTP hydrolase)
LNTFQEYERTATAIPVSLRNDRDRIELPVRGLQEEAGKIGSLFAKALASGKFHLTQPVQNKEVKDRLADVLWYVARLCDETGISMQQLATHSIMQLQARIKGLNPDQR